MYYFTISQHDQILCLESPWVETKVVLGLFFGLIRPSSQLTVVGSIYFLVVVELRSQFPL